MASLGVNAAPFAYAAHVLAVAATVMVLVWNLYFRGGLALDSPNKNLIFNLHPVLTLIGFIVIGGEGIISYKTLPWGKKTNKIIHLTVNGIAIVLGAIGVYAVVKFHNESGIANFYSLHSWLGIGALSLFALQWIYGFVVFFYPGGEQSLRRASLPWHVVFGLFVYLLAVVTAEIGFLEKLTFLQFAGVGKYVPESFLVNFTGVVVILLAASVVVSVIAPRDAEPPQGYSAISEE